jgi:hypothetical protein
MFPRFSIDLPATPGVTGDRVLEGGVDDVVRGTPKPGRDPTEPGVVIGVCVEFARGLMTGLPATLAGDPSKREPNAGWLGSERVGRVANPLVGVRPFAGATS